MHVVGHPGANRKFGPITIGLLAVRVVVLVATVTVGSHRALTDDLARFHEISLTPGKPYRDFSVEYMPGETLAIVAFDTTDPIALAARVAIIAFIADIATWAAILVGWGASAAERYLWLGAPLLVFIYTRFDLVPVALAAWGATLALRRIEPGSGLAFAAAIFSKVWPFVVVPALLIMRRSRAFWWCLSVAAAAILAWIAYAGAGAATDVLTFRHATGWGVESVVGTVVWIATGGPVRLESGAPRIGSVPTWASIVATMLLVTGLLAVWEVAAKRRSAAFGSPSVAAVSVLLVCSPLLSVQYAAWLLPWAAIAWVDGDRRGSAVVFGVEILSAVLFMTYDPTRAALAQVLLTARNALLIALPVMWLLPQRIPTEAVRA